MKWLIHPLGPRAAVIDLAREISEAGFTRVCRLQAALLRQPPPGVREWVPGYTSLTVHFEETPDPVLTIEEWMQANPEAGWPEAGDLPETLHVFPVCYGGESGPDLKRVADRLGLPPEEVVRRHSAAIYRVFLTGFAPGFAFLGPLDESLRLPRRSTPRDRVPPGSVALAEGQTGIYPCPTPGGWHIIGRTPVRLFDPNRPSPFMVAAGQRVRFEPIDSFPQEASPPSTTRNSPEPLRGGFVVEQAGGHTSVQATGRKGCLALGVPPGGALDRPALLQANLAVANQPDAAALEITWSGPVLRFYEAARIALAGADFPLFLDDRLIPAGRPIQINPGSCLHFGRPRTGLRAYLGFAGGLPLPSLLGCCSTCLPGGFGGWQGRLLQRGDHLPLPPLPGKSPRWEASLPPEAPDAPVRILPAPETSRLPREALITLTTATFRIGGQSNRSGLRLEGSPMRLPRHDIISSGLVPGTIQLPASGCPIIVLADGPTVGGYARIAVVHPGDLDRLAQLRPGERLRFREARLTG